LNSWTLWSHQASHHITSLWNKGCWSFCLEIYQAHSAMPPSSLFAVSHSPSLSVLFLPALQNLWTYPDLLSFHLKMNCLSSSIDNIFRSDQHAQWHQQESRSKIEKSWDLLATMDVYTWPSLCWSLTSWRPTWSFHIYWMVVILCRTLFIM
jgi:hypothetical protein